MTDAQRAVANYYNIPKLFPTEWPAELDESDEENEDNGGVRRSRSRYSALERSVSDRRSFIPGSQRTGEGKANLAQKDESDPLGGAGSVVQILKQRGMAVEQDSRLRNRFLLSSTTFNPALFLSKAHSNASTEELISGLNFLSRSIDQKSASLKVLVETNFDRFVRAKATIDNVYTEMRTQGTDVEAARPPSPRHSRRVSRNSNMHYRNFSTGSASGVGAPPQEIPKHALRKETEYGVKGIKQPLLEVSQKVEDVWGPALGGREREANLKAVAEAIEKDKNLYELGTNLSQAIKLRDYDRAVQLYNSARTYTNQARTLGERAMQGGQTLTDEQIQRILVTGRMWLDVEEQIRLMKRDLWRRLSDTPTLLPLPGASQAEEHMDLIAILLELGVKDNPIWVWLLSRYSALKTKISMIVDRSRAEVEILRRRLASSEKMTSQKSAVVLRQASKEHPDSLDSELIVEFWDTVLTYVTKLLSLSGGLLGEIVDFWDSARSFIEGHKQKSLPTGFEGQSREHHRLSDAGVKDLQNAVVELVGQLRDAVYSLFAEPPTEDISALFSPVPDSAKTPITPMSAVAFSPSEGRLGKIDPESIPDMAPKTGEAWEDFGFWPPRSNTLSAVHYLGKIMALIGLAAKEMVAIQPADSKNTMAEKAKNMVAAVRERSVRALCESWSKDSEHSQGMEDWTRDLEKKDQTKMPLYFEAFERKTLVGIEQVMFIPEATTKPGAVDLIGPPPSKLLQMVKTQFVNSIYKTVSGMLENAEAPLPVTENVWSSKAVTADGAGLALTQPTADAIPASTRSVRMLLTLSNMKAIRDDHVPGLVQVFETSFCVKLTDESKTIRDVFSQVDAKLFHSYTKSTVGTVTKIIKEGISQPDWAPGINSRPDQVRPYVYAALMLLVMIHTEVSTTISSSGAGGAKMLSDILSYLLENVSQALLDGFKERKPNSYTLPALMQATLDTEFIAQTLSQYSTPKASEIQSQIYTELDKRTTNDARTKLQQELGDMRVVLKKLREGSRNSFACFKRPRSDKERQRKNTG